MTAATAESVPVADGATAKKGGKKKLLLLAAPVVLLLAGAGLWFTGVLPHMLGLSHEEKPGTEAHEATAPAAPVFFEVPELVANLNGNPRRPSYIKVKPRLELTRAEDVARLQAALPRILDMFQTFLRETRPEELRGSAGIQRLREELIARANLAAAPAKVVDVLFVEMLIQ